MSKVLLYSSGIIAEEKPTGGELRFLELARYLSQQAYAELCCADKEEALEPYGLHADIHMNASDEMPAFLPEEARIWLANSRQLKKIAGDNYTHVIVFDVPPAIGLVLSGVENLILMVRKDLIGYERVKSKGKGLGKIARIVFQWLCEDLSLRRAKLVVCQCGYDRDVMMKRHPFQRGLSCKFRIQINNVNPSWIEDRASETTAEKREKNVFRVCFIGGFSDLRKGQDLFLKAARELTEKYEDIEFVLVGGGKSLQNYQMEYESEKIQFRGRMDNPMSILKSADLLVVPSRADSCPNTVMEALFTGVPVIGSRAGGIPEILQDDEALFEAEHHAVRERIEHFYRDRSAYERLIENQRVRSRELTFDWAEKMMNLILE